MNPDLVYIVRGGENEELRYSLRSVAENLPHATVWLVGGAPKWVRNVDRLGFQEWEGPGAKWRNIVNGLAVAADSALISDRFVYMNDDQFVMWPQQRMPVYHGGWLSERIRERANSRHVRGFGATARVLEMLGAHPLPYLNYELHVPLEMNRDGLADAIKMARTLPKSMTTGAALHVRTLYGNLYGIDGEFLEDPKIRTSHANLERAFLSTNDRSFKAEKVGAFIRDAFPNPCKYEEETT